jgi:polyvinyl alcohol dehydrogenase (cytochrome)
MLKICLILFGIQFTNITFCQSSGEKIYQNNCSICHNGTIKEAPKFESLQKFSQNNILKALQTGIMKVQGSAITANEQKLVAEFISKNKEEPSKVILGKCAENNKNAFQNSTINSWGMGLKNQRYIADNVAINTNNISKLIVDWVFAFPNATCARTQPTVAGNTIFTASQQGVIYALEKTTGCIKWTYQADNEVRSAIIFGTNAKGFVDKIYFSDIAANVYAFDIIHKKILWKQHIDDHKVATITGSIAQYNGVLYVPISSGEVISAYNPKYECCTFRGSVIALNAKTGNTIWKTYTVDEPKPQAKNAIGTQNYGPSGAPVWSNPTIDEKRQLLYIGTGENYSQPATKTSDAILALDLKTGKIKWATQTVEQDAWNAGCTTFPKSANCPENNGPDYDFGAPPILVKAENGKDMLLAGQKSGIVFGLNPDDGTIIWQKQVGRGGIMGGVHWGMATNQKTLFVPINDKDVYEKDKDKTAFPGVHAVNVLDGKPIWSVIEKNICEKVNYVCAPGISAAITLIPGIVFGASIDGRLHAYNSKSGDKIWEYDTNRDFETVNNEKGSGGTIDSSGPVIVGNQLFINSGYAKFGEKAGNVLIAFKIKK